MTDRRKIAPGSRDAGIILGLGAFARISAIEGVRLDGDGERMFAEFEREGMSAEQRRRAIREKHAKKA